MLTATTNPCANISKFKTQIKDRFLSNEEIGKPYPEPFRDIFFAPQNGITAIRLLMMTGCRKNEIVMLRWDELCLKEGILKLKDSKTGKKEVILSENAINILEEVPNNRSDYVFPGKDGKANTRLQKIWKRIACQFKRC